MLLYLLYSLLDMGDLGKIFLPLLLPLPLPLLLPLLLLLLQLHCHLHNWLLNMLLFNLMFNLLYISKVIIKLIYLHQTDYSSTTCVSIPSTSTSSTYFFAISSTCCSI